MNWERLYLLEVRQLIMEDYTCHGLFLKLSLEDFIMYLQVMEFISLRWIFQSHILTRQINLMRSKLEEW